MLTWTQELEDAFLDGADGHQPASWFAHGGQAKREACVLSGIIAGTDAEAWSFFYNLIARRLCQFPNRDTNYPPVTASLILSECDDVYHMQLEALLEEGIAQGVIPAGTLVDDLDREAS